ncbi:MAG: hypothetical protein H6747_12020 [Deltaproteobacteria bacterium]|nr:hypothetical protein [Deltaproteobacteria bacterium]
MKLRRATLAALLLAATPACKRDADRPLPPEALYPDTSPNAKPQTAAGPLERVVAIAGREPDDRAEEALTVPADSVVEGTLTPGDIDWIRIHPLPPTDRLLRVDLHDAPACARLSLFLEPHGEKLRSTRPHGDAPATLPSLALASLAGSSPGEPGDAAWLQVRCVGRRGEADAPLPYRLALGSRPARPEEEREPNDTPGPETRLLGVGAAVQGTLAPRGDVDAYRLDLTNALPGDATLLSVTGIPGVAIALELRVDGRDEPLLLRKGRRGEPILVPNIDVRRTGRTPLLLLRAEAGESAAHAYAATIRPLLPAGCRTQGACPERVPVEREPNDLIADAMGIRAGGTITAILDNQDDVDVFAIDGEPGQILRVTVDPPEGVRVALLLQEGNDAWASLEASEPGAPLTFAGRRIRNRRVYVTVRSVGGSDRTSPYTLHAELSDDPSFEFEGEATTPLVAMPEAIPPQPEAPTIRAARGCLLPGGDIDRFGLQLEAAAGPRTIRLRLGSDGAEGLSARLLDATGQVRLAASADGPDAGQSEAVTVEPGAYDVIVERASARPSLQPYRVEVLDLGPALVQPLPQAPTPTAPMMGVVPGGTPIDSRLLFNQPAVEAPTPPPPPRP